MRWGRGMASLSGSRSIRIAFAAAAILSAGLGNQDAFAQNGGAGFRLEGGIGAAFIPGGDNTNAFTGAGTGGGLFLGENSSVGAPALHFAAYAFALVYWSGVPLTKPPLQLYGGVVTNIVLLD